MGVEHRRCARGLMGAWPWRKRRVAFAHIFLKAACCPCAWIWGRVLSRVTQKMLILEFDLGDSSGFPSRTPPSWANSRRFFSPLHLLHFTFLKHTRFFCPQNGAFAKMHREYPSNPSSLQKVLRELCIGTITGLSALTTGLSFPA